MLVGLWAFFGTLTLLILTYQDVARRRIIDDRKNQIMLGASVMLLSVSLYPFWYFIIIILSILFIVFVMKRYNMFGGGDLSCFTWSFLGFAYLNIVGFLLYGASLIFYTLVLYGSYRLIYRGRSRLPVAYFPVILASFVTTCLIMGFYLL